MGWLRRRISEHELPCRGREPDGLACGRRARVERVSASSGESSFEDDVADSVWGKGLSEEANRLACGCLDVRIGFVDEDVGAVSAGDVDNRTNREADPAVVLDDLAEDFSFAKLGVAVGDDCVCGVPFRSHRISPL